MEKETALQEIRRRIRSGLFFNKDGYDTTIAMIDEIIKKETDKKEKSYTHEDMRLAYEYGQEDCGEFGTVKGFGSFIEEHDKNKE